MSFLIQAGYRACRNTILNVSLKDAARKKWHTGIVYTPENYVICALNPRLNYDFELVRFSKGHALLMNDNVVYESPEVFQYNIELTPTTSDNLYRYLNYTSLHYADIRQAS
jgi:hypothetical protein